MTADVLPEACRQALALLPDMMRARRARDGLSQRDLAKLLGVSNATPSRLESGCAPDLPILLAVLAWLGVPLSWFDGRSEQPDGYRRGWDDCEAVVLKALAGRGGPE